MLTGASARRFSVTQTNWGAPDLITEAPRAAGAELVAATLRDVTPETLRRVYVEVKARGPFAFDLRKAFWPYWLHALTRHRWRRSSSRAGWFAFSV